MKSSTTGIIAAIVIIFLLAIAWFFIARPATQQDTPIAETPTENTTTTNVTSGTRTSTPTEVRGAFREIQLSNFSTPLKSKAAGRLNNIRITCQRLDGYVVKAGATFSFNEVVGQPTAADGYQEADVLINGEMEKAIGGGNCQVSTTLYNSALMVSGVEITERHEHGKAVSYVEDGKDAAVSYGSWDLKFVNHTGKDLTLHVGTDDRNVTAQITAEQ